MTASILKVGIAGYGVVGRKRGKYIKKNKNMILVAVCDRHFKALEKSKDGVVLYNSYKELLNHDLDVLFVCLTNDIASEVTIAALKSGLHVFCEKPPGQNIKQISEVLEVEKGYPKLKLKYGFNHRYHESVKDARKLIESGELGRIVDFNAVYGKSKVVTATGPNAGWRSKREIAGGGILLDQGIHMVDLIRYFSGEFEEIHSFISNNYWKYDVEDNAYAIMRNRDGVVALIQSSATRWRHDFNIYITLQKGSINLKGILSSTKSYGAETLTIAYKSDDERGDPKEKTIRYNHDPSWEDEVNEFSDSILKDKKIISGSSDDAFKTMQLVYRIYCADIKWKNKYNLNIK